MKEKKETKAILITAEDVTKEEMLDYAGRLNDPRPICGYSFDKWNCTRSNGHTGRHIASASENLPIAACEQLVAPVAAGGGSPSSEATIICMNYFDGFYCCTRPKGHTGLHKHTTRKNLTIAWDHNDKSIQQRSYHVTIVYFNKVKKTFRCEAVNVAESSMEKAIDRVIEATRIPDSVHVVEEIYSVHGVTV